MEWFIKSTTLHKIIIVIVIIFIVVVIIFINLGQGTVFTLSWHFEGLFRD